MTSIIKIKSVFTERDKTEMLPELSDGFSVSQCLSIFNRRFHPVLLAGAGALLLTGCEAPLNLQAVEQERAKSVHRTDQLQSLASTATALIAVGSNGLVLRSETKAQPDWQRQQLTGEPSFIEVVSCPDNSFAALAMDRTLWRSSDDGISWQLNTLPTQENVLSLACAPDNSLWVTGSFSTILSSRDQGQSWQETSLNEDAMLTSIQFLDADHAIVAGEFGMISRTADGGDSWQLAEPIPDDFYPQGSYFKDADHGWVAGLNGAVLYTRDGGRNWQRQATGTESPLYSFQPVGDALYLLGDHGTVLKLAGERWQRLQTPTIPVYLRAAASVGEQQLLVAGGWGALFTVNTEATIAVADNTTE